MGDHIEERAAAIERLSRAPRIVQAEVAAHGVLTSVINLIIDRWENHWEEDRRKREEAFDKVVQEAKALREES